MSSCRKGICQSALCYPVLHTFGCHEKILSSLSEDAFQFLHKIKVTKYVREEESLPEQDLHRMLWGKVHPGFVWRYMKLQFAVSERTCYPCSSFFFCLIKTDTFLLHLLSDHFYWVLGRSLYHFSHPVIFNLLLEQNRDEDIIHIQKCYKKTNILSGLSITTVYNSDESFGYPY